MAIEAQIHRSTVTRILDWVRNSLMQIGLAGQHASESSRSSQRNGGTAASHQGLLADPEDIRLLLEKLAAAQIDVSASMIQMVQLGDVRQALGDQWPKVAKTAMSVAETMLKHRLGQSDIFTRYQDYGFVVVFGTLNVELATARAEALSHEISELLLKKPELKEAIGAQQVTASVSELTGAAGGDPLEAMNRALDAKSRQKSLKDGTKPMAAGVEAKPKPVSQASAPATPPAAKAPPKPMAAPTPPPSKKAAEKPVGPKLVAMYQPVLIAPKKMVGISLGVPQRRDSNGKWLIGQAAYTRGQGGDHNLSLDLFMCGKVVGDMKRAASAGGAPIVASMARIESLMDSTKFAENFEQLSEKERNRLILQIVALNPDMPVAKIQGLFGRFRSITNNLVLHLRPTSTDFGKYAAVGVGAVGCHLTPGDPGSEATARNVKLAKAFGGSAKKAGLHCHIYGVDDAETFAAATGAGAQYISGKVVGPLVDSAFSPYPYAAEVDLTVSAAR